MKLYKTIHGAVLEERGDFYQLGDADWDVLLNRSDHELVLTSMTRRASRIPNFQINGDVQAPIGNQEVWAAGVTYYRSRTARMEESKDAGGGSFYDRVYAADRPELFFKATPHRVSGPGQPVRIRKDSQWNVPEPELTLVINSLGQIIGYTIGNDMSSRDIEGENLLYLPQAKTYHRSCALGPWIVLGASETTVREWPITLEIRRGGQTVFKGETSVGQIKRRFEELAEFLFRCQVFPGGAVLLTGTGIVPPETFTLREKDEIIIHITGIGTLQNSVVTV